MSFEIGQQVGPYRVERQVGKGGMATVYLARHQSLDRDVALKMLHVAYKDDDSFIERFRREAQIVGKLDHPNIVPIYDFADVGLHPYLVMKYIEGDTLKQYLRRTKEVDLQDVMRIMTAVASALDFAHQRGILHRDVKPSNIMISNDGEPYLTDFGLARIASLGESTLSRDMMLGTPQYISPEQAQGNRELDARTDIYSMGIVLYELVVGRVPFTGDTPYAIIHNHIFTPLPPPREMNPTITPEVEMVLMQALAKDPNDRFSSAGGMITAFKNAINRENITELSASAVRPEAFAEHAAKSMQQPMIQSPLQQQTGSTSTPTPTGGMWMTNTKKQTKRQSFFGLNIWTVSGCGMFVCSCMMMFGIFANAATMADSLAVEPIFPDRDAIQETLDADVTTDGTPAGDTDTASPTLTPTPVVRGTRSAVATITPYPTRATDSASEFESLSEILASDLTIDTAQVYVDNHPEDPLGYFALGILYLEDGQQVKAQQVVAEVMRQRDPSVELVVEVIDYLETNDHQQSTVRLIVSAMTLHADNVDLRESGREYLLNFISESNDKTDLILLCQLNDAAANSAYIQSLMGLWFMNNQRQVRILQWPVACPEDVQLSIDELLHLETDSAELLPEIQLIQAKYYVEQGDAEMVQIILQALIDNEDSPEWLRIQAEEGLATFESDE